MESFTHATRSRWEDARKRRRVFGYRSTRLRGSRTKENSSHRSTPPMDPRMNHVSSPPNASRLTIVNHCRVAALSPSTRRLTDATVRLLVLVRKSDGVTRKYVHRARARVFARAPSRSRSRSSTRTDVRSPRVSLSKPVSHCPSSLEATISPMTACIRRARVRPVDAGLRARLFFSRAVDRDRGCP